MYISRDESWKIFLPYCLREIDDGKWIFLNRRYKPLGVNTTDFINYNQERSAFRFVSDPGYRLSEILGAPVGRDKRHFFFYTDGYVPIESDDFWWKLKQVMNIKIRDERNA